MTKLLRLFALGGNEISPTGEINPKTGELIVPNVGEQWVRSARTCELLSSIVAKEPMHQYILTHGNGPQVGNILLRSEYSKHFLHTIPLDVCGADTQGAIGYMLAQLSNFLRLEGVNRISAETITQVEVDPFDEAFNDPTKFIGPALSKEEAEQKVKKDNWKVKLYKKAEDGREIWRRVVPSPEPKGIVEIEIIESNLIAGIIPIAVGGGGIPVERVKMDGNGNYEARFGVKYKANGRDIAIYSGVEAVIDKDLATSFLGTELIRRAHERGEKLEGEFTIFTDVDGAKLNFQKPNQIDLRHLSVDEAQKLYDQGKFPGGSMGPKIKSAINFIRGGGSKAYISKVDLFLETLKGNAGTTIVP